MAEYEAGLLRYATRIVGDTHHAQDVVQMVFVKLFRSWKKGTQPTERLKPWLYRVTHNQAVDTIRRESRLHLLHTRHAEESDSCPDGHNCPAAATEKVQLVMEHVHGLQPAERQVLLLRLEEGLSYKQIAAVTGRSQGNIGCLLHHAVKKLTTKLKTSGVTA